MSISLRWHGIRSHIGLRVDLVEHSSRKPAGSSPHLDLIDLGTVATAMFYSVEIPVHRVGKEHTDCFPRSSLNRALASANCKRSHLNLKVTV